MGSRKTHHPDPASTEVLSQLGRYFRRNGYVRRQNRKRLSREGRLRYKKGDEVRLTAQDEHELLCLQALVRRAGFRPGRPFAKGRQYRLPVYGREAVRRFLQLVESGGNAEDAPPNSRRPSQLPASPEFQPSDSQRTPSSGGCG